jgi:hypothetical protein
LIRVEEIERVTEEVEWICFVVGLGEEIRKKWPQKGLNIMSLNFLRTNRSCGCAGIAAAARPTALARLIRAY